MTAAAADPRAVIGEFAAHLRAHGFPIGFAELGLMVRIAADVPLARWRRVEPMWRSAVASDRRQWERFPELFRAFWFPRRAAGSTRMIGAPPAPRTLPQLVADLRARMGAAEECAGAQADAWSTGAAPTAVECEGAPRAMGGASRCAASAERPFAEWLAQDVERFESVVAAFARRLRRRLLRRWEAAEAGRQLHLRRSLRAALATEGELIDLQHRRRRRVRPRVAVMVDVSRSMERHAPLYLRVAQVFGELARARVFVFHTRLAEVGALLRRRGPRVQARINAVSLAFGGGTRIATSLAAALDGPLRGTLGRRDLLLVCSDGFDADPPGALAEVLARAQRRGIDIVWLHPTRARPASLAMTAAASAIRAFVPAHDLASLARLPQYL
jgi:uncharacterized protein with von Willebrand factor type A (vWA) domain